MNTASGTHQDDVDTAPLSYQVLSGIMASTGLVVGHTNWHTLGEGNFMVSLPGNLSLTLISHAVNYGVQPVAHLPNLFIGKAGDVTVFVVLASEDGKAKAQLTCCILPDFSLEPVQRLGSLVDDGQSTEQDWHNSKDGYAATMMHG